VAHPGQRDVDAVGAQALLQLAAAQLLGTRIDPGLERPPRAVQLLAPCPALVGRKRGKLAEGQDERGLPADDLDPDLLERSRAGGRVDPGRRLRYQSVYVYDGRVV
jgi:hypothetical protein